MPFLNLSPAIGTSNSIVVNTSYIIANQPPQMTTQTVWLVTIISAGLLLLASRAIQEPTFKDLAGVMAVPLFLIGAIQSFAIDVITGTIFTSGTAAPYLGVMVQTHTIYHYDLMGVILGIFFVISLLNLYLLWLDHKRITNQEQEQMDRQKMQSRSAGKNGKREEEGNDNESRY